MSILWIYDKYIDPHAGGTERATQSIMSALQSAGHSTAGFLVICQESPRKKLDYLGRTVDNLYAFLKENSVHVVVNQIGYSKWLLEEFLLCGGQRWKDEGGRIITCLHFDPSMFSETLPLLSRQWASKTILQKVRRLGRMALLPISRRRATINLRQSYSYLIENSDRFVILSEKHRQKLLVASRTQHPGRIYVIPNPNTYSDTLPPNQIKNKVKTALIVSRLDEQQKRVSLALLAWDLVMRSGNFDDWILQVLGDGEYRDDYRELVRQRNIRNIQFLGRTDPEMYYNRASLYLHTAKREGWGLTITEAMQKGVVPIVMRSSSVFDDMIQNGQSGILTNDGDIRAFATNIADLMTNNVKRERMAELAIEATFRYDAKIIVEKWSALLSFTDLDCATP